MTTTSGVTSTAPTISTGNAQDVSGLMTGQINLSLAEAVTVKVQPYLDQATAVQTNINTNQTKIAAYQNMQSLLQALESSVANLTSEAVQGSNVFNNRAANLSSISTVAGVTPSAPNAILSANIAAGTPTGSHTITVNSLAAAESDISSQLSSSYSSAGGTFTIAETGKTGAVPITVAAGASLNDIASAINGATSTNGVTASVVSVNSTTSVLVVSGVDTDQALQFTDGSGVLAGVGLVNSSTPTTLTGTTSEASNSTALGLAGSFSVNGGGTVTVTSSMTLSDIATAIGNAAGSTGVTASVVGAGPYQLQISGGSTPLTFTSVSGNVLSTLGIPATSATNQVTAPQAADLTVDGVTGITRSTNTITDLLSGTTLNLSGADPNTQVTLNIAPDTQGAATAIQSFVTAYNNWQNFVNQNEATNSDGTAAAGATLFGDSTLRDASQQVSNSISSIINNYTLAQLGLTLDNNNNLQVDSTTLTQQLTTNFSSVAGLFDSQVTTDNSALQSFGTDYSSYAGTFTMGITDTNGTITLDSTSAASFTVNGTTISGNYGTPYYGISLNWIGGNTTGQVNVNVTGTQGLANQLYSSADEYGNAVSGSVQSLISNLQTEDLSLTNQYNTLVNQANDYSNFLLQQYSQLTTQIQNAGQTVNVLNALFSSQTSGGTL